MPTTLTDTQRAELLNLLDWAEALDEKPRPTKKDRRLLREIEERVNKLLG